MYTPHTTVYLYAQPAHGRSASGAVYSRDVHVRVRVQYTITNCLYYDEMSGYCGTLLSFDMMYYYILA